MMIPQDGNDKRAEAGSADQYRAGESKPCPFCGGKCDPEGWSGTGPGGEGRRGPECEECGATAESLEAWNRRDTGTRNTSSEPSNWGEQYRAGFEANKLEPCPFCGGAVELERTTGEYERHHGQREWWGVVCRNTINVGGTCAIQQIPSASKEAAVERWNRRTPAKREASTEPSAHALIAECNAVQEVPFDLRQRLKAWLAAQPARGGALTDDAAKVARTVTVNLMWPSNKTQFEWLETEKDAARLSFVLIEECYVESLPGVPTMYRVNWPEIGEVQREWSKTPREAIDAAIEAHTKGGSKA